MGRGEAALVSERGISQLLTGRAVVLIATGARYSTLRLRVTPAERQRLGDLARRADVGVSEFVRGHVLRA